ncbi:leucine-rich repeat domain-containing protein [Treponema sp. R80B11-R83G3]
MKKIVIALLLCTALCAAVFAQNASDFKTDGKGTITGYEGWDKVIVIPEKIGGVTITAIADKAFERLGLTGLTLPASIKTIGREAFSGSQLTTLTIPAGVTIGGSAFANNQLASLTVGDKVTIGESAFASNKLTSLKIPAGVTIGESAFANNQLRSLTIPAGVTIGKSAFSNNQLASLTVGDKVTIGENAFSNNKLTSITVGNGGSIANGAFENNKDIKTLVLGEGIDIYRSVFNLHVYYDYMCNNRKAGTYDNTVKYSEKTEGDYTFVQTKYGAVIIKYKGGLQAVQIPAKLGGTAVKGIDYGYYMGAFSDNSITRMQLPEGLAFIGYSAFAGNNLTSLTIPNSVTYIGESAFSNNQLTSVTLPDIRKTARFT